MKYDWLSSFKNVVIIKLDVLVLWLYDFGLGCVALRCVDFLFRMCFILYGTS